MAVLRWAGQRPVNAGGPVRDVSATVDTHLVEVQELRLGTELNRRSIVSQRSLVTNRKAEMNRTKCNRRIEWVLCGTLAVALSGCTTYVEHRPARTVYVPPPPAAPPPVVVAPVESSVVVIQAESDFYEPLAPHGEWVVVESYGRCWRPTRVEVGWRPYADGYWRRTDAGWYWVSAEPWGWATYHYGRWDWSVEFGWIWVPHTQWAPAWVSWRQGAGYVGWAPLPPAAGIRARGIVEVHETAIAPRAFVFVSEQRLLDPVRPTTVIVNNTTLINQTVNITQIQVVNKTVINEGPRPEIIERKSGRRIDTIPVRELRGREETAIATRRRNSPSTGFETAQPPLRSEVPGKTAPTRDRRPVTETVEASPVREPQTVRREVRKPVEQNSSPNIVRPQMENPLRNESRPPIASEKARLETAPPDGTVKGRSEANPTVRPRETHAESETIQPRQLPARRNEARGSDELKPETPARPDAARSVGNTRQRELERGKMNSEPGAQTAPRKPTASSASKPVEKLNQKPAARKPGEPRKKVEKKGEEQETPRPGVPPQSPP